jgi:hypothetical protein
MPDIIDQAQELSETRLAESLSKRKTLTIPFSGSCLSCGEPVEERRYCDASCREDHEEKMRRNMRS